MAPEQKLLASIRGIVLIAPVILMLTFVGVFEYSWRVKPQPFPFNHKYHAGDRGIDCKYCHRGTDKGHMAGVPSVSDCWACHQNLTDKGQFGAPVIDRPDVQRLLKDYVETKKEIKWYKVYDMPEHVKFPHKAHINAGLQCTECHGHVENMAVVQMNQKPHMGWCVGCHRQKNAPVDCTVCHY
ncbi:MAG: cytochrome c3 family protein [Vulcanimicrobiota bacterium]